MKTHKIPMRSCIITHEKLPKQELIRIVRTPDNKIIIDQTGKANGRGAYLKKDLQVIAKAKQTKQLNKPLKSDIPDQIFEELNKIVTGEI